MSSIDEREKNLFNATDTLAQFYDEIESFLDLLFGSMERLGFADKEERLRSGTFAIKNLPRRLLATAMIMYFKGAGGAQEAEDDEPEEDAEEEGTEVAKAGKAEVTITPELRIPFVSLALFEPKTIPSVRTLESPRLFIGAFGKMRFIDKKTGDVGSPDPSALALSNLVQLKVNESSKEGDLVRVNCWRPKAVKKYRLEATLVGFESRRLLEIDSQDKIKSIAETLASL